MLLLCGSRYHKTHNSHHVSDPGALPAGKNVIEAKAWKIMAELNFGCSAHYCHQKAQTMLQLSGETRLSSGVNTREQEIWDLLYRNLNLRGQGPKEEKHEGGIV